MQDGRSHHCQNTAIPFPVHVNPTVMMRWFSGPACLLLRNFWLLLCLTVLALPGISQRPTPAEAPSPSPCPTPTQDESSLRALLQQAARVLRTQDADKQNFTWQEHESRKQLSGGVVIHSKDETWEVSTIAGRQYKRLIARDGHPLKPDEEQARQKELQASIEEHASPSARAELAQKRQKEREREQRQQVALLHNFHFTLSGSRSTPWGKVWVLHATPIAGVNLNDKDARLMSHFAGELWVDASSCHLTRLDLTVLDPIAFGWILGKVDQGGHLLITFAPIDAGNWFPQQFSLQAHGRILFKHLDIRMRNDYFDYRRFPVESSIRPATPINDP